MAGYIACLTCINGTKAQALRHLYMLKPSKAGVMKVTIFETESWEDAAFRQSLRNHALHCTASALNESTAAAFAESEVISTFMNSKLGGAVLKQLPALRLIVTRSVGFDHVDLNYCHDHNITVCNIPDYGDYAVAEQAFALLLAIGRRIVPAVERCRQGWFGHQNLRGFELQGKTLGVIGTGRIGRRAIEIANGFGMTVVATIFGPMPRRRALFATATAPLASFYRSPISSPCMFRQHRPRAIFFRTANSRA